jgi:phage-related tail fiber protein
MAFSKASVRSVQFTNNVNLTSLALASVGTTGILRLTNGVSSLDTNTYISGNQTITVSGDVSGSGTTSLALTLADSGVTAGTYTSVTVNAKGLVTAGSAATSPTITVSGDATGSGTTSLALTLANSGATAGTYKSVTVNAKGLVTAGTNPNTMSGYGITDGATLGANIFTGIQTFVGIKETKIAVAASAIDVSLGTLFTKTISGATTFTISNTAASGLTSCFILELTNGGSATITWWSGVKWAGGTVPTLTSAGVDILGFYTYDGGTTWRGVVLAKDSK